MKVIKEQLLQSIWLCVKLTNIFYFYFKVQFIIPMLNSNDLFAQIGFMVDSPEKSPSRSHSNKYNSRRQSLKNQIHQKYKTIQQDFKQPQYVTSLEIELSEDENHILQIKSFDDPYQLAVRFCSKHNLNKLAIEIVEKKIIQAKQKQQQKLTARKHIRNQNARSVTPHKQKTINASNVNQRVNQNNCNQQFLKNTAYRQKDQLNKSIQRLSRPKTPSKQGSKSAVSIKKQPFHQNSRPNQQTCQIKAAHNKQTLEQACQSLYFRGRLQAKALQQKRIKRQQQLEKLQQQQLTFKPKINQVSQKIIQFRKQTGTVRPKNPSKVKKHLTEQFYKQIQECTFTPEINPISKIIVHNREAYRSENQHFNQLFGNSQSIDKNATRKSFTGNDTQYCNKKSIQFLKKQQAKQEQSMFKPKLNPKSIDVVREPFNVRLQKAVQMKQKIKQGDFGSDGCTFQPKVGRAPYYQISRGQDSKNNKQNIPVWQHLYKEGQKRLKKKQKLSQNAISNFQSITTNNSRANFDSSSKQSQNNSFNHESKVSSNLYYENLIQKRINIIFELLDSDSDGMISPNTIGIQNLNKNTLIFLKPIFEQMDELNAELNYNEFKKAVINLLNDSDPYRKGLFLSDNCKKRPNQLSFKPEINPKSKALAEGRNNTQIHVELYEQGVKNLQRRQFMLQKQRTKKQEKQLAQCSFKPSLKLGGKNYKPHIFDQKLSQMHLQIKQNNEQSQNQVNQGNEYQIYEQQYD